MELIFIKISCIKICILLFAFLPGTLKYRVGVQQCGVSLKSWE